MLSRTAAELFWLGRHIERMEYVARLIDVAERMALLSTPTAGLEWRSAILAAGVEEGFKARTGEDDAAAIIDYLVRATDNASSLMSCLASGRENARAVRAAITADVWEAVNDSQIEARSMLERTRTYAPGAGELLRLVEWVKQRSQLIHGALDTTMLRNEAFWFTKLGILIERADNTARILDVKYHVLLPSHEVVGGGVDYFQWKSILQAVSARRSYHALYRDRIRPWLVAEMLILRPELPRSMRSCFDRVSGTLDLLSRSHGGRTGECHRLAGELTARLRYGRIDDIFQAGLHQFLTHYIDRTAALGDEIGRHYLT